MLILVTRGECTHVTDFEAVRCRVGSLMLLKPSQAEMFDAVSDWDGWVILFEPEFLFPVQLELTSDVTLLNRIEDLAQCMHLTRNVSSHLEAAIKQMRDCCEIEASIADVNAVLRYYLSALLLRICLMHGGVTEKALTNPDVVRFRQFKQTVAVNFCRWHQVCDYARALECSDRTLTRATLSVAGVSAKRFILDRIILESKRLLAYTSLPTSEISSRLGFDEATNFVKFFRRETGSTPGIFRGEHR
ncbi:AraC-like DNA-binding protein [Rhizobium pisi]